MSQLPGAQRSARGLAGAVDALLQGGVDRSGFVLQPLVELRSGRVRGFEALARFTPSRSASPTPWFAAAAELGRLAELEAHLIRRARGIRETLPSHWSLAVNVSPAALASRPVTHALRGDLTGIILELTEHVEYGDLPALLRRLDALRAAGAQLALDDVGAGWSGLRQLTVLRPDIVKLDRSLVADVDTDHVKLAVVQLMHELCSRLGSQLLVEGVETHAELDVFSRMGIPLAQGWVFGRPSAVPAELDLESASRLALLGRVVTHQQQVGGCISLPQPRTAPGEEQTGQLVDRVLLDDDRRPLGLVRTTSVNGVGVQERHEATVTIPQEAASSALRRALTRPPRSRFVPLICTDRAGRYLGLVPIENLIQSTLDVGDANAASPDLLGQTPSD
jgi:EAL domain-containing protein (putative c-di-GMP-specific phosphodiesterase class I)